MTRISSIRLVTVLLTIALAASCRSSQSDGGRQGLRRHTATRAALGTIIRITLYTSDARTASAAIAAAFDRLDDVDTAVNADRPDSELAALNSASEPKPLKVSDDLFAVLQHAQRLAASSRGAFDVTSGPYAQLWRRAAAAGRAPSQGEIEQERLRIGWEKLRLDSIERTATLTVPGMSIDLTGIARGYAVDQVMQQLHLHGCDRARVDAESVVFVGLPPPGAAGWPVSLRGTGPGGAPQAVLERRAIAFAGTGNNSRRQSQIIVDPTSGRRITNLPRVAVAAPSAATAQSVAAIAVVLGSGGAESLARIEPMARVRFADQTPHKASRTHSR
jgi:FAD:protein FMN transferase